MAYLPALPASPAAGGGALGPLPSPKEVSDGVISGGIGLDEISSVSSSISILPSGSVAPSGASSLDVASSVPGLVHASKKEEVLSVCCLESSHPSSSDPGSLLVRRDVPSCSKGGSDLGEGAPDFSSNLLPSPGSRRTHAFLTVVSSSVSPLPCETDGVPGSKADGSDVSLVDPSPDSVLGHGSLVLNHEFPGVGLNSEYPVSASASPKLGILPSPRSLVRSTSPAYPVLSSRHGLPDGSRSASTVFSGVPAVPERAHLQASANFKLSDTNFPPLVSHPADSADPLCSTIPQANSANPGLPSEGSFITNNAPATWASLVKDTPSYLHLKYIKPEASPAVDGKLRVKLPSELASKGASAWKNTLVGFFLDKLPFSLVHAAAHRHWGKLGLTDVLCNGNGFFFFKFSEPGSLKVVLEGGPWYFGGRPIFLKLWTPGMNLSKEGCKRVPIWVHFFNVPLELWTDEGLSFIASTVGKPLHADSTTSSFKRLNYARICIEINIEDSLPNAFDIELEDGSCLEIQIEYNWVPKKCSICKDFGHLSKNCKKACHRLWIPKTDHPPVIPPSVGDRKLDIEVSDILPPTSKVLPGKILSKSVTLSCGDRSSRNFFECLPSEDVPPAGDHPPSAVLSSGCAGDPSNDASSSSAPLPVASEAPVAPLGSEALADPLVGPSTHHERCSLLSGLPLPAPCCVISSPSSSPSETSLLARKLIMVDEVDRKQGKKKKGKQRSGSSSHSRGNSSLHS